MIEKKIRRFELNLTEAMELISDHLEVEVIRVKLACETVDGGLVIEVEVEG